MTFKPARLLLALLAIVALPVMAQNVAVVNGKNIPTARLEAVVKQVVAQGQRPDSKELRDAIKQDLIAREVLMQESVRLGYEKDPTVKQQLENARQAIVINAMVGEFVKKNPVTDAEIKKEYDIQKAKFGDKEYHVRHILLENEADAKAVIAKLKAGGKFDELAKTSKDQGTAANGGDLDWATASSFPKQFADAFMALQPGQVSENPVQTPAGFHVVKLDETRPAKVPTLEEAKAQLAEGLQRMKVQAFQEDLVKKAKIK